MATAHLQWSHGFIETACHHLHDAPEHATRQVVVLAVVPAKAGTQMLREGNETWIPAFAGMTTEDDVPIGAGLIHATIQVVVLAVVPAKAGTQASERTGPGSPRSRG